MISSQSSVPESFASFKNLLLTGSPGCGKTTVLKLVLEHLGDLRLAGFLTMELREHGQRVGFEAVGLGGQRVILVHIQHRSLVSVGRYGVEPDRLVPLIEEELNRPLGAVDANLIDEFDKMDCRDSQFTEAVSRLLEGSVPIVATIVLSGRWLNRRSQKTTERAGRHLGQAMHGSGEYTLRKLHSRREGDGLVRSQQRRSVAATKPGNGR
jgi:nucleoside-triphosphatase